MSISTVQSSQAAQLAAQIASTTSAAATQTSSDTTTTTSTVSSSSAQSGATSLQATIQALTDQLQAVLMQLQQSITGDTGQSDGSNPSSVNPTASGQTPNGSDNLAQLVANDLVDGGNSPQGTSGTGSSSGFTATLAQDISNDIDGTSSTDTTGSGNAAFMNPNGFMNILAQDISGDLQGSLGSTLETVA